MVSLNCDVIPAIVDSLDRSVILATDDVSLDSDVMTVAVAAVVSLDCDVISAFVDISLASDVMS